jgi:CO dehydrogenase/acetyl-CoA synthase alpha subunit
MFQTAFQVNAFQNNAFQINVVPISNLGGGDDAWVTKEELRRIQKLQQKIAERQRKLEQATKDANASRKQAFRNLIDPVAKVKQPKVQSKQEVKANIPLAETEDLERSISYLENQLDNILEAVAYRQETARIQAELRMLEAKRLEELDDEESVLILLH